MLSIADPSRYLAVGGADAIASLWDLKEWICIRTFDRQEYISGIVKPNSSFLGGPFGHLALAMMEYI